MVDEQKRAMAQKYFDAISQIDEKLRNSKVVGFNQVAANGEIIGTIKSDGSLNYTNGDDTKKASYIDSIKKLGFVFAFGLYRAYDVDEYNAILKEQGKPYYNTNAGGGADSGSNTKSSGFLWLLATIAIGFGIYKSKNK